jgi:DNA-binding FrmR family transcriptional regulator
LLLGALTLPWGEGLHETRKNAILDGVEHLEAVGAPHRRRFPSSAGVSMAHFKGNEQQLIHRISGIEGHVRSLKKLIGEDREPLEILMQISSIRAAMERLSHLIFEEFVEGSLQGIHSEEERTTAIADIRAALETLR